MNFETIGMLYAEIIPAKRGRLGLPFFDYLIPPELEQTVAPGQLAVIPLRSKSEFGIIRRIKSNTEAKPGLLKPITSLNIEKPFLDPRALDFFDEISALFHTSLGLLVKSSLPPLKKRKLAKCPALPPFAEKKSEFGKPKLFIYPSESARREYFINNLSTAGQTLILVPETADVNEVVSLIGNRIDTAIIKSGLSDKEQYDAWFRIRCGDAKVIIGTRSALFFSFHDLRTIMVDREGNSSHKSWDSAPRFNTRDASLAAGKYLGASVHFLAHTPSVETYYFAAKGVYYFSGQNTPPKTKHQAKIIDLNTEITAKNYNSVSIPLEEALVKCTGQVFLYCNRKGTAAYVMCRDCAWVFSCRVCNRPYTYHESRSMLSCHHCKIEEKMTASCPKCGGVALAYYGAGTERVAREVKKIVGDSKQIIEIEAGLTPKTPLELRGDQIIVGTQFAISLIDWSKISILAFIDSDTPLFVPEYRSAENTFQTIRDLEYRLSESAQLFIQTSHTQHAIYAALVEPGKFYAFELRTRKLFGYPPFKYLLKLFYGGENKVAADTAAELLKQAILRLTKEPADITISGPLDLLPPIKRGRYWVTLIVKLPYGRYKHLIRQILRVTSEDWKVDPNPNTLLSF